jgi:hypothetical protein
MRVPSTATIRLLLSFVCAVSIATSLIASGDRNKPSLSLKASPPKGFPPARVVFVAELRGGANDYEEFYCASEEWEWGDGTTSVEPAGCEPFQAGKSRIARRHVADHVFDLGGDFLVEFRLKQRDKVVGFARTCVSVRPGARDPHVSFHGENWPCGLTGLDSGSRAGERGPSDIR